MRSEDAEIQNILFNHVRIAYELKLFKLFSIHEKNSVSFFVNSLYNSITNSTLKFDINQIFNTVRVR
jgi:hypothetical protein